MQNSNFGPFMSKPEADILTPDPTMNQYAVSLPTAAWNTFLRQSKKIFRRNSQTSKSFVLQWWREGKGRGASQWKTAASCHCCKVTLGLFMASAEGRAGAAAYIHPPPSKSESKIEFQLIEGKNVWKPKLNKVVRPRPLLTFHLWLGKLWKSSGWRNFPGSHLH